MKCENLRYGSFLVVLAFVAAWAASPACCETAAASRPTIVADFEATATPVSKTGSGQAIVAYEHEMAKSWGYPEGAAKGKFMVIEAAKGTERPPLLVWLHGAGGKAGAHYPSKLAGFGPEFVTLSLECHPPKGPEGWYGLFWALSDVKKYANEYAPPENRYLGEIEWVVRKYNVDRNRIYVWGSSMGGTGTLGLCMDRGDIFAAVMPIVPAGTDHVFMRMNFPARTAIPATRPVTTRRSGPTSQMTHDADYLARVSGVGLPDAPPIINLSSPVDGWATNQENLLEACHDGRHLMIFSWSPAGHTDNYPKLSHPSVEGYPWLSIRKNEAYPVFTDASTDDKYPGLFNKEGAQSGQINGYFRWKSLADEGAKFQMELRLVDTASLTSTQPVTLPASSTVDVTLRRLQKFAVAKGKKYTWKLTEGEKTVQSGTAAPDEVGLLTIPRLTITQTPRTLIIEPEPAK